MNEEIKERILSLAKYNQSAIARKVGESPQVVNSWLKRGIPTEHILTLCWALNWEITPHEIDPKIYPNPTDALPTEINKQAS